jgi:hypothetical protein
MTRGERNFEIGDKVFDIRYGWGEVESFEVELGWENVEIRFDNSLISYTVSGPGEIGDELCLLSFTEYTLNGFTSEKPIDYSKFVGKWGKFWNDDEAKCIISRLGKYDGNWFILTSSSILIYENFKPLSEEQIKSLGL